MRELAKALGFATHGYIGDLESGRAKPLLEKERIESSSLLVVAPKLTGMIELISEFC